MSRLTNCCGCEKCEPEQLYWVEPGENAPESKPDDGLPTGPTGCVEVHDFDFAGPDADFHHLTSDCGSSLVTTRTDRDTLVLDVYVETEGYGTSPYSPIIGSFFASLKLWCDEHGANEALEVRLRGVLGGQVNFLLDEPESFQLALRPQPQPQSFQPNFHHYSVFVDLLAGSQTKTVQLISPSATLGIDQQAIQQVYDRYIRNIHFRVVATHANGECDVYVTTGYLGDVDSRLAGGLGGSRGYTEGETSGGSLRIEAIQAADAQSMGIISATHIRHAFETQPIVKVHGRVAGDLTCDPECKLVCRAKAYSPGHPPAIPAFPEQEDEDCYCTPTGATGPADCYVDRTMGEGGIVPADMYSYPWYTSPCAHVRRGSRITHAMVSGAFSGLSVTLPEYSVGQVAPGVPYEVRDYIAALPTGPYELVGTRDGTHLADNNFWCAAGAIDDIVVPGPFVWDEDRTFVTHSMTLGATLRTTLLYNIAQWNPSYIATACPGDQYDWATSVNVWVYLRGAMYVGDSLIWNYGLWITHTSHVGSELFRGDEVGEMTLPRFGRVAFSRARAILIRRPNASQFFADEDFEIGFAGPMMLQLVGD